MEKKIITINAEVFIIPNHGILIKKYIESFDSGNRRKLNDQIAELNNITIDPNKDHIIQLWFISNDLETENLERHGAIFIDNDANVKYIKCKCEYLVDSIFKDHVEGDIINIKLPAIITSNKYDPEKSEEVILDMNVKLNQLSYRYKNFGPFEEVLKYVLK